MPQPTHFDQNHAAQYDQRFSKLAPFRDALHLLIAAILSDLPTAARILCVGAGTGAELIYLAQKFPHWHFTAVDPSEPMLDVCRRKTAEHGLADRCVFHEGYLDSLPPSEPFHAATSLLVSQFILDPEIRTQFFRTMAELLHPGGILVSADLASGPSALTHQSLLEVWLRLMKDADFTDEKLANLRVAYSRDVAILPLEKVSTMISSAGFELPILFLQTGLIHGWHSRKPLTCAAS